MGFHHVLFPLDIALGARGGPEWATDIVELASGAEERNSRWAQSRRRYDAGFGVKSKSDLRVVLSFFEERRGSFHSFLFRDPIDHSSADGAISAHDQKIGIGDGTKVTFHLVKTYGATFDPYVRNIMKPEENSVLIALDGVPTTAFAVDETTGMVTLDAPPASGVQVTAGFIFNVPVRFAADRLDVEITSFDAAHAPTIKLVEVRA
ncbi:DUF2460 domain-containing protein [Maritalea porphyrae]|uniref:Glycoside hydrolase family 24 n=1 Tax=Maritalea porphyrae TaxID=880732 RepID=A0ABQ5URP8_9HYPH|nr:DUF2460 domain-containing protein [Maritalea porphyrae]GLQ17951.1 glycoside hydrolase family 24 [Maritalea porphyrae]